MPGVVTRTSRVVASAMLIACGSDLAAPSAAGGNLVIQTRQDAVSWGALSSTGAEATIYNASSSTFYTNIGDAFNGADEQDPLLTSAGSDAVVQIRASDGAWIDATESVLIEGTKYVKLKPGKRYRLLGFASGPVYSGPARIQLDYRDRPSTSGMAFTDYSNIFTVQ